MVANSHDNITGGLLFVIPDQLRCASPFVAEAQEEANEKCLACSLSLSLLLPLSLPNQGLCEDAGKLLEARLPAGVHWLRV